MTESTNKVQAAQILGETAAKVDFEKNSSARYNALTSAYPDAHEKHLRDIAESTYWHKLQDLNGECSA